MTASPIYETPPMGPQDQDAYLNMAVRLETELDAEGLLSACQQIEQAIGRQPAEQRRHWGPREIDLDLLLLDDRVLDSPEYCDTEYAFHEGDKRTIDRVIEQCFELTGGEAGCDLYEVTGGEPLLQRGVHPLMTRLCDLGKTVLIETSGACDIGVCDPRVVRIMDLKTPGSGEAERNDWSNIDRLNERDEVKFVLTSREDYDWMVEVLEKHRLHERVNAVLVSAVNEVTPGLARTGGARPRGVAIG
eukprot:g14813.t1